MTAAMSEGIGVGVDRAIANAYSESATSWRDGPTAVYSRLAEVLVDRSPVPLRGAQVIDIGAGTGAASRAARRAGARSVLALDSAVGMLTVDADRRPPAVAADATRLPFRAKSFDVAVAAFSLNHLHDPAVGLVESARVVKQGGAVVASAYAADDQHPVKAAVEQTLIDRGWTPPAWQVEMYRHRAPQLATVEGCGEIVRTTGVDATITNVHVGFPDLGPTQLVAWRLGMAQHAPFLATLTEDQRREIERAALHRLGDDAPPLVRSIMVIAVRC